jgi:hypothetical protein
MVFSASPYRGTFSFQNYLERQASLPSQISASHVFQKPIEIQAKDADVQNGLAMTPLLGGPQPLAPPGPSAKINVDLRGVVIRFLQTGNPKDEYALIEFDSQPHWSIFIEEVNLMEGLCL